MSFPSDRLSKTPNNAGFIDPSLAAPLGFTGRSLEDDVEIEYESSQDFGVEDSWQTGIIMSLMSGCQLSWMIWDLRKMVHARVHVALPRSPCKIKSLHIVFSRHSNLLKIIGLPCNLNLVPIIEYVRQHFISLAMQSLYISALKGVLTSKPY
ncbi:uncharacterized protein [Lolium perenne]|uniref:uncharacterized protein isoform X2 n=1 Tax=Lolium perenne TaxID=4522 RepID=UPI003A996E76